MMNFVIERIEEQVVNATRILSEGCHRLLEARCWNLWPESVDCLCAFVPKPQNVRFWKRIASDPLIPISGDDSPDHRRRDSDHLLSHSSEGPHRADGKVVEPVLRKGFDHAPG